MHLLLAHHILVTCPFCIGPNSLVYRHAENPLTFVAGSVWQ